MSFLESKKATFRQRSFKKGIDADESRHKREQVTVQLRRQKREALIAKRRQKVTEATAGNAEQKQASSLVLQKSEAEQKAWLNELVHGELHAASTPQQVHAALQKLRLVTAADDEYIPVGLVIDTGVVPDLIACVHQQQQQIQAALQGDESNVALLIQIQVEALWILANLASDESEQCEYLIHHGWGDLFVTLLKTSKHTEILEQVIWGLGNMLGDSSVLVKQTLLSLDVLPALLAVFTLTTPVTLMRIAGWGLSNLCRSKPALPIHMIRPIVPVLIGCLDVKDDDILVHACWIFAYLTADKNDDDNEKIQAVVESGVCPTLISLLNQDDVLIEPVLRTLGNIISGSDLHVQVVIDAGMIDLTTAPGGHEMPAELHGANRFFLSLIDLLDHNSADIRKDVCWILSNIAVSMEAQISAMVQSLILPKVIALFYDSNFETQKEIAWILYNICAQGNDEHVAYIVNHGAIEALALLLACDDPETVLISLKAVHVILSLGNDRGTESYVDSFEQCGGADTLDSLPDHYSNNEEIYDEATEILDAFFEDIGDDQQVELDSAFSFEQHCNEQHEQHQFSFGGVENTGVAFSFGGGNDSATAQPAHIMDT